jgi:hypothetical protein
METVTLKGEDFRTVHNTLCELREIEMRLNTVLSADMVERLHHVIRGFEQGLKNAYEQDEASFDDKMDYYRAYQNDNDFAAIWSMYELPVHGFLQNHPYPSDVFVIYGKGHVPVFGATWGDVYRAADCAIRNSGDLHHIFIEAFEPVADQPHQIRLTTGS